MFCKVDQTLKAGEHETKQREHEKYGQAEPEEKRDYAKCKRD
jgi:hypothetical protein